jgi:hypothetical protein
MARAAGAAVTSLPVWKAPPFSIIATTIYQHSLDRTRDTVKARIKLPGGRTVDVAGKVAGNTANIPKLEATAPVLGLIVDTASGERYVPHVIEPAAGAATPAEQILPVELVVRASTAPPPARGRAPRRLSRRRRPSWPRSASS